MRKKLNAFFSCILAFCMVAVLLAVPMEVRAADTNGTDTGNGEREVEMYGDRQTLDVSSDGRTLTYEGGTARVELNGSPVTFYGYEDGTELERAIAGYYLSTADGTEDKLKVYVKPAAGYDVTVRTQSGNATLTAVGNGEFVTTEYDGSTVRQFFVIFNESNPSQATINGTNAGYGDQGVEINGAGQSFDVSADGKTLTYQNGTVSVKVNGSDIVFYGSEGTTDNNNVSARYYLTSVGGTGDTVEIYITTTSNADVPSVRIAGSDAALNDLGNGTYKTNVYDGSSFRSFGVSLGSSGGQDPGPVPPPENAISIELWDNLGNLLNYGDYSATTAPGSGRPVIGANVQYSYNGNDWFELSNSDANLAFDGNRYVFDAAVQTVYLRVAGVSEGFLTSCALEGYDDGHKVWPGRVSNGTVYTLTNPGAYDLIFDNGRKTVIWSYNAGENADDAVLHGTVEIVSAVDAAGNNAMNVSAPYGQGSQGGFVEIKAGATVTVRLTPDYGYQFVSGSLNGEVITAGAKVSTFTFIMPDTNLHLSALFTASPDQVTVTAADVTSGSIEGGENVISSGNLKLTVADSDMNDAQRNDMASSQAAADVDVTSWLELDLDQIVNKGNETDVWASPLKELNEKVTITLNVGTGLDAAKSYVVIREHNGVYERLPATYDAEAGTLTFQTDKFSDYAIGAVGGADVTEPTTEAETEAPEGKSDNDGTPKTGDNTLIELLFVIMLITGAGILLISKKNKVMK